MNSLFNYILNSSNIATVVFNNQQQLSYYNQEVEIIWGLEPNTLETGIAIVEFFEILREKQIYPQKEDLNQFCNRLLSYFNNLQQPIITNLILGNGKNLEENIFPYQGGLIFIWEDTTKLWETIYSLNNYKNLYNRIINSLPLPVIIIGSNGLIEGFNLLFCNFFKINSEIFNNEVHITKLVKKLEPLYEQEEITAYLVGLLLSRKDFSYSLNLINGMAVDISGFPLPNGNNFIIFRSASVVSPKLNFGEIKNTLKELQESLILDLEKLLNTPINTIIGFADMLKEGYLGELNSKQQQYIKKIINQAETIKNELNYKAELTLFQDTTNLKLTEVDINEIIVAVMQQIKAKLQAKNIKFDLNITGNINSITTNQATLVKLLTLSLLYLIEQNLHNTSIEITITNNPFTITFKDTSTLPLFSPLELNNRFDLILILKNLELLQGNYKVLTQNRAFRALVFSFKN